MEKIKNRKSKTHLEDLPLSQKVNIDHLSKTLAKQIDSEVFRKNSAPISDVLKLVGAGSFFAASLAFPALPMALRPFISDRSSYEAWKRFNIPYLKRTLERLEKQKLVEISEEKGMQVVKITDRGRKRILRCALDELTIKKPKIWDRKWRLVTYDLPEKYTQMRNILREYLSVWGFYRIQESVFLHAYPCMKDVEFLREYLGMGEYVRGFLVEKIENDQVFRDYFGV